MEPAERRMDRQRIDVSRPIELIHMEGDSGASGFTRNLSEGGVRAWIDEVPDLAANVLVRLSLVDGREPVEKPGRIVWCAPDIYGEGTDVGIHLIDDTTPDQPDPTGSDRPPIVPAPTLAIGQLVRIETEGIAVEARVETIGELGDDGVIDVQLSLVEEAVPGLCAGDEDDARFDAEDWTPHPFRDAWRTARRFLLPVLAVLAVAARRGGRAARWIWRRVPARPRTRLEAAWDRFALRRRAAFVGGRLRDAGRWTGRQWAILRAARGAKRSGETSA